VSSDVPEHAPKCRQTLVMHSDHLSMVGNVDLGFDLRVFSPLGRMNEMKYLPKDHQPYLRLTWNAYSLVQLVNWHQFFSLTHF
jgi:hypothetical protein